MNEHERRAHLHLKMAGVTIAQWALVSTAISMVGFIILAIVD